MKREIYTCDICSDEHPVCDLFGLRFTDLENFVVGNARSTDGKHLCVKCAKQLTKQLPAKFQVAEDKPSL